ncbi:DUF6443 domain-containing protein, partial [Sphingobacterium hotanense]|uniref:DUF6443 domain-containing protein n=1 Tax=Sphingobacterium hotanense TaxID=649196 RepID=UPI0028832D3E
NPILRWSRPSHSNGTGYGKSTYQDIVQHVEYDGFGRESVRYLPYAEKAGLVGSNNGSFKANAKSQQKAFYSVSGSW